MQSIKESHYKPDFEISDRYINFSSELLRLSLIAITGIGALIILSFEKSHGISLTNTDKLAFFTALMLFALSSGAALTHRFYASDAMSYHIAYLRTSRDYERTGRTRTLKLAARALIVTEYLFGFAVAIFAIAILLFLLKSE